MRCKYIRMVHKYLKGEILYFTKNLLKWNFVLVFLRFDFSLCSIVFIFPKKHDFHFFLTISIVFHLEETRFSHENYSSLIIFQRYSKFNVFLWRNDSYCIAGSDSYRRVFCRYGRRSEYSDDRSTLYGAQTMNKTKQNKILFHWFFLWIIAMHVWRRC